MQEALTLPVDVVKRRIHPRPPCRPVPPADCVSAVYRPLCVGIVSRREHAVRFSSGDGGGDAAYWGRPPGSVDRSSGGVAARERRGWPARRPRRRGGGELGAGRICYSRCWCRCRCWHLDAAVNGDASLIVWPAKTAYLQECVTQSPLPLRLSRVTANRRVPSRL